MGSDNFNLGNMPQMIELDDLVHRGASPYIAVVGERGTGKTSLLAIAARRLRAEGHLVVAVSLVDVGRPEELTSRVVDECLKRLMAGDVAPDLRAEIEQFGGKFSGEWRKADVSIFRRFTEILEPYLGKSRLLVLLFDGIDETRFPPRVATFLIDMTSGIPPQVRMIVTSRSLHDVKNLLENGFLMYSLSPLRPIDGMLAADYSKSVARYDGSLREQLVVLLLLFSSASISLLAEASGRSTSEIEVLVQELSSAGLISRDREQVTLSSRLRRVTAARNLLQGSSIENFHFGAEAAEHDPLLKNQFLARPDLARILTGEKTIILGDRGAGKSALFRRVQEIGDKGGDPALVVAAAQDPANVLQMMTVGDTPVSSPEKFKALWLLYVAALAAWQLQGEGNQKDLQDRRYTRAARTILRGFGWSERIKGEGRMSRLAHAFAGAVTAKVKISVGPIAIEPTGALNSSSSGGMGRRRFEVYDFLRLTDDVLVKKQRRLLVAIDQIDEAHKYERPIQEAMVQGLMLAESFVAQSKAIRLAVFLRTDLWETYDIQEKNKFVLRTATLGWAARELETLLLDRLCTNEPFVEIGEVLRRISAYRAEAVAGALRFFFPEVVEGVSFIEWLFSGMRNARDRVSPRQVILFLNLSRDSAMREVRGGGRREAIPVFGELHLREAMTQLSEFSYEEVVSDFRVATGFVRNLRAGKIREFDLDNVKDLFDAHEGSVAEQVERLERLGFLGRELVEVDGGFRSRFRVPSLFTRCWEETVATG
jgi:predicted transcriptional regulator/energy-coupling factor transporter ATP-binding protein EcfA2